MSASCFDIKESAARTPATVCSACEARLVCPQRCSATLCEFSAIATGRQLWSALVLPIRGGLQPSIDDVCSVARVPPALTAPALTEQLTMIRKLYTSATSAKQAFKACWDALDKPRWSVSSVASSGTSMTPSVYGSVGS